MLTDIIIENFTVVEKLQVTLHAGLCVLSGETGAGKSIIVDAVQLVLGRRADVNEIRFGENTASITAYFNISNSREAENWLKQHEFYDDAECVITRTLHRDGRSRSTINGKPCATGLLREIAPHLLIIHGQHDSQTLLQRDQQEAFIDRLGKHEVWLEQLNIFYQTWRKHHQEIAELQERAQTRENQLAFLQYQHEELTALNLQPDEWVKLHQEHQRLHHAKELLHHLNAAIDSTVENEQASSTQLLHHALEQLKFVKAHDPHLASIIELLETAAIHLQEAGDELIDHRNRLELSPERLHTIEQRLTQLHDLARKHHVSPEELPDVMKSLQQQITTLTQSDERIALLLTESRLIENEYQAIAQTLSASRERLCQEVSVKITAAMQELGMQGGEFQAQTEKLTERMSPHGLEKIIFLVKTNPGQALQALAKVVSGGELSRLSLALQTLLLEQKQPTSLIFDEVDTGIGGKTAEIVGALLKKIGQHTQVFCITHLPQVACQANHHYLVSKISTTNSTKAVIQLLNQEQRVEELARMLSGSKITASTRQHATELLTERTT